jgi:hypothetical protein
MKWLIKVIRVLSPNCKESIRLQSDALDRPLWLSQRIGLRAHLALCVWCSRYGKQIKFLRSAVQHSEHDHGPEQTLPSDARERIKRALKDANN